MADTNRLVLPLLSASQAQKHVTVNEAMKLLDAIVQAGVIDKDLTAPPGSPTDGDIYIVGGSATDDWAGQDDDLAIYQDGAWVFVTPLSGWIAWVDDENVLYVYNSGNWESLADILGSGYLSTGGGTLTGNLVLEESTPSIRWNDTDLTGYTLLQTLGSVMQLAVDAENEDADSSFDVTIDGGSQVFRVNQHGVGIGGASADATNGFSFFGTNVLFNSSGSIAQVFNKDAAGDDASFTFQQGFSSYALMGLLGDNNFSIKVGTGATTALVIDESTGILSFPQMCKFSAFINYEHYADTSYTTTDLNNEELDIGNVFASGTFTAPVTGTYRLGFSVGVSQNGTNEPTTMQARLLVNGTDPLLPTTSQRINALMSIVEDHIVICTEGLVELTAGDEVVLQHKFGDLDGYCSADITRFWGELVAA